VIVEFGEVSQRNLYVILARLVDPSWSKNGFEWLGVVVKKYKRKIKGSASFRCFIHIISRRGLFFT